jgi:DNA-binding helix-hairpin-helix protein with protein kinase domain
MSNKWCDQHGRPIVIGDKLGVGGEGAVFTMPDQPQLVAKIYHRSQSPEKCKKLQVMSALSTDALNAVAAWPVATLHPYRGGPVAGIVMPRLTEAQEIHELYSPAHRKANFPKADWRFLIRAARNCAGAFAILHQQGIVIGDVNQGNVFVTKQALVRLIDCDSFQLRAEGQLFRCTVGVAHFTPPELQSAKLSAVDRNANHDNFGLAVLLFHLLFMGRHPYSGRPLAQGDLPLEKAIREHRFAYGRNAAALRVAPPPHTISLTDIPASIGQLFERAFAADAATVAARPTAAEWHHALGKFESELRRCDDEDAHYYWGKECCWCRIVVGGGPQMFVGAINVKLQVQGRFDLAACWRAIEAIPSPEASYRPRNRLPIGRPTARPFESSERGADVPRQLTGWLGIAFSVVSVVSVFIFPPLLVPALPLAFIFTIWWGVLGAVDPRQKELALRRQHLKELETRLEEAKRQLRVKCGEVEQRFLATRASLQQIRERIQLVDSDKKQEIDNAQSHQRDQQLNAFLDKHFISNAKIDGIGTLRKATLASYGIETAADVTSSKLALVPGFGPVLCNSLISWRRNIEWSFKFDPTQGVPGHVRQQIESKYATLRRQLEKQLAAGPGVLKQLSQGSHAEIGNLEEKVIGLEVEVLQAQADCSLPPR